MASHITIQLKPIWPPIPCTLQKGLVASHTMIYQKPYMASHECKDNNICNIPSMFDIIVFQLLWSLDTQCYYHCIYMIFQPTRNVYDMIIFWFKHQ